MELKELFDHAPAILGDLVLQANLLRAFIWYLSGMFLLSLVLRLRFYLSVYEICKHVKYACPNLFQLIDEHWMLIVRQGMLTRIVLYLIILLPYVILNR